ncbi:hypothetical protein I4U23_005689 [Adineta vaga]|nr:hypothetical protein I4U23_005689 [Adineta vaga]
MGPYMTHCGLADESPCRVFQSHNFAVPLSLYVGHFLGIQESSCVPVAQFRGFRGPLTWGRPRVRKSYILGVSGDPKVGYYDGMGETERVWVPVETYAG